MPRGESKKRITPTTKRDSNSFALSTPTPSYLPLSLTLHLLLPPFQPSPPPPRRAAVAVRFSFFMFFQGKIALTAQVYIFARKRAPLFCAPFTLFCCCCFHPLCLASLSLEKHFIASWTVRRSRGGAPGAQGARGAGQLQPFLGIFSLRAGHA